MITVIAIANPFTMRVGKLWTLNNYIYLLIELKHFEIHSLDPAANYTRFFVWYQIKKIHFFLNLCIGMFSGNQGKQISSKQSTNIYVF